jgi:RND family efflux transporter MFP subunit
MVKSYIAIVPLIAASLAACYKETAPVSEARPVRAVTVENRADGEVVSLTGQVRPRDEANLAFRLDGRMVERTIQVGDIVSTGQIVARLDPQIQQQAVTSAQANLQSVLAVMTDARITFERQQKLFQDGWTSRANFDDAEQKLLNAEGQVKSAQAQLRIAEEQQGYTNLYADGPGAVTAVGAEPGEVVRAGQMVVQVARQGGHDAVFDAPEQLMRNGPRDPMVEIALSNDPQIKAIGRVREIAPEADPATRTFRIKVGITDPPEAMRLGATVVGRVRMPAPEGMEIPASALARADGAPSVWVVDPQSSAVSQRTVEVLRYDPASVVISQGLSKGDVVVTAGAQTLRPGQKVQLPGAL